MRASSCAVRSEPCRISNSGSSDGDERAAPHLAVDRDLPPSSARTARFRRCRCPCRLAWWSERAEQLRLRRTRATCPLPVSPISTRAWPLARDSRSQTRPWAAWRRRRSAPCGRAPVRAARRGRGSRRGPAGRPRAGGRAVRPRARAAGDGAQVHAGQPAGGFSPSRNCSISWRIFSSELSTVMSMSCWNSGCRAAASAFFIISDNCVTMFFRSCTTKADMRLKASNLRASSSASVACICARKLGRLPARRSSAGRDLPVQLQRRARPGQHDEAQQGRPRSAAPAPRPVRAGQQPGSGSPS
jgi:hypothetical protein